MTDPTSIEIENPNRYLGDDDKIYNYYMTYNATLKMLAIEDTTPPKLDGYIIIQSVDGVATFVGYPTIEVASGAGNTLSGYPTIQSVI